MSRVIAQLAAAPVTDNKPPGGQDERRDFGVLFVHGIGSQKQGETLTSFANAMVHWLQGWYRYHAARDDVTRWWHQWEDVNKSPARLHNVRLKPEDDDVPASADLTIAAYDDKGGRRVRTWRVAESWWAEQITAPKVGELLGWVAKVVPWIIWAQVWQQIRAARKERKDAISGPDKVGATFRIGAFALLAAMGTLIVPVVVLAVWLCLLLLRIPIPGWSDRVTAFVTALSSSLGDSYLLLRDPAQYDLMCARIERDLTWLQSNCQRVAVVAHSQGAALVHDVLQQRSQTEARQPATAAGRIAVLVTVGSGIGKLLRLRELVGGVHRQVTLAPAWGAAAIGTVVASLWAGGMLTRWPWPSRSPATWVVAAGALLVTAGVFAVAVTIDQVRVHNKPCMGKDTPGPQWWRVHKKNRVTVAWWVTVGVLFIAGVAAVSAMVSGRTCAEASCGPWWPLNLAEYFATADVFLVQRIVAMALLVGGSWAFARGWLKTHATMARPLSAAKLRVPPSGPDRWVDVWARADPVPNGALREASDDASGDGTYVTYEDVCVTNKASLLRDHSAYIGNVDEFGTSLMFELFNADTPDDTHGDSLFWKQAPARPASDDGVGEGEVVEDPSPAEGRRQWRDQVAALRRQRLRWLVAARVVTIAAVAASMLHALAPLPTSAADQAGGAPEPEPVMAFTSAVGQRMLDTCTAAVVLPDTLSSACDGEELLDDDGGKVAMNRFETAVKNLAADREYGVVGAFTLAVVAALLYLLASLAFRSWQARVDAHVVVGRTLPTSLRLRMHGPFLGIVSALAVWTWAAAVPVLTARAGVWWRAAALGVIGTAGLSLLFTAWADLLQDGSWLRGQVDAVKRDRTPQRKPQAANVPNAGPGPAA